MLSFFRRLRQNFLQANSAVKYAYYAIGEIALVVIGILIALQINNWNESRKDEVLELEHLKNLRTEIEENITEHNWDLVNARRSYLSTMKILRHLEGPSLHMDTLRRAFSSINVTSPFFLNSSAFQSLKAMGIQTISKKEIRDNLTRYYDFFAGRITYWQTSEINYPPLILNDYLKEHFEVDVQYNLDSLLRLDLNDNHHRRHINQLFDGSEDKEYFPVDFDFVLNDPEFKIVITNAVKGGISLIRLHLGSLDLLQELSDQVVQEIKKLE